MYYINNKQLWFLELFSSIMLKTMAETVKEQGLFYFSSSFF